MLTSPSAGSTSRCLPTDFRAFCAARQPPFPPRPGTRAPAAPLLPAHNTARGPGVASHPPARVKGTKMPETTIIPSVLITKENAKQYYVPDSPF